MTHHDDSWRSCFSALADTLVPAGSEMPSATDVDVAGTLIERALAFRQDLAAAFESAVDRCRDRPAYEAIDDLARLHPDEFAALSLLTAGAYYLSPMVRARLGYHGGQPRPAHDDVATYVDMLESVVERGPLYRQVD